MKNFKKILGLFIILGFSIMSGCKLSGEENCQYTIIGNVVLDENNPNYEIGGFEFKIANFFPKAMKKFIVCFTIFDENGIPLCKPMFEINGTLKSKEYATICLNLDDYLVNIESRNLVADFIYLSKIVFEDGSEWSDPFGLKISIME